MPLNVVITDLMPGTCELTGKEDAECIKVQLEVGTPELICRPAELIKLLRLRKRLETRDKPTEKKGAAI